MMKKKIPKKSTKTKTEDITENITETKTVNKTINKVDSWPTFFKTFQRLHQAMDEELKNQGLPNLEVYDVLWTLEQTPKRSLRFYELANKVYLARFGISRLCPRLVKLGLIKKVPCPLDGRGFYAQITNKGLKLRKKMWAHYGSQIVALFSERLSAIDHQQLKEILSKITIVD